MRSTEDAVVLSANSFGNSVISARELLWALPGDVDLPGAPGDPGVLLLELLDELATLLARATSVNLNVALAPLPLRSRQPLTVTGAAADDARPPVVGGCGVWVVLGF